MAREVREPKITHVTITGRVVPMDNESYMELLLLAHRFRKSLVKAVKMYAKGLDRNTIVKEITKELNLGYADTIYKLAKLIVEGVRHNNSNPLKIRIRKLFIASRGFTSNKGNRNIRLSSSNELQVNVPWRRWIKFKVVFGRVQASSLLLNISDRFYDSPSSPFLICPHASSGERSSLR